MARTSKNTSYSVRPDQINTTNVPSLSQKDNEKGSIIYDSTSDKLKALFSNGFKELLEEGASPSVADGAFVFVSSKEDLPTPSAGVITLAANTTYYFVANIDLLGDRLAASANTVILGSSSENCSITSTGLGSDFLLTTEYTMPVRHITFKDVTNAIDINAANTGAQPIAIDWYGVNFSGCSTNILLGDLDNFIFSTGAVLSSGEIVFAGSVGTIGITNSLFTGDGSAAPLIQVTSAATITRRFRVTYSSFVAFGSTEAVDVEAGATVPTEGFILDTCNFSGGGTYLPSLNHTDNESLFVNNVGIINSADVSQYYMNGNATATVVSVQGDTYKVAGTTTSSSVTQKFTNTNNRATYIGALTRFFKVTATLSANSGNNNQIGCYVAKNGSIIADSEVYITTNASGRAEAATVQTLVQLTANDYIEIFVENDSGTTDITVTDLNVIIE